MTAQPIARTEPEDHESRRFRRVEVGLRVALQLARDTACLARTANISEGGMLLVDYHGPQLAAGRLVGVNLRGVLSDGGEDDSDHYLMRVVRHHGERVALRFSEGDT